MITWRARAYKPCEPPHRSHTGETAKSGTRRSPGAPGRAGRAQPVHGRQSPALWSAMRFPLVRGLIHGDAHISNLMRAASGEIVLGDWDHVATGPGEWDLVQIHYMHRRFGRADEHDIDAFTAAGSGNAALVTPARTGAARMRGAGSPGRT